MSSDFPALTPRKAPRQRRSAATVATILEAATRILSTESLTGFNTNRVAEVAGISIGSLYQYFPNKAALMAALIAQGEARVADGLEALVSRLDHATLRETVQALARFAVAQQFANPLLAAALDHEEARLPLAETLAPIEARLVTSVNTLVRRHHAELAPDLPASAAQDCLAIAKTLVETSLGRVPVTDLEARITRALLGYLTVV